MSPAINSMSSTGGESVTDINTKYQKLATEYAKLRSQVPILLYSILTVW